MKRKQISDEAFTEEPQHHVTNPMIKAARKAPPKSSKDPEIIRMQVSFKLPDGMGKQRAAEMVKGMIEHWASANPSWDFDRDSLQVLVFKAGFKT